MIDYKAIREELNKAIALSKQHSSQKVPIQQQVHRKNGTTFMQTFYKVPMGSPVPSQQTGRRQSDYPGAFSSRQAAEQVLGAAGDPNGAYEVWKNKLSKDHFEAIKQYTGRWFRIINGILRDTLVPSFDEYLKADEYIPLVEQALDKYELKQDVVLHRQVEDKMLPLFQKAFKSPDKLFVDEGFFSTTAVMDSFKKRNGMDLIVKVPKGKGRGAWVQPLSRYPHENEFLLNNHSIFTVNKIEQVNGRWRVELTWIGRSPKGANQNGN